MKKTDDKCNRLEVKIMACESKADEDIAKFQALDQEIEGLESRLQASVIDN